MTRGVSSSMACVHSHKLWSSEEFNKNTQIINDAFESRGDEESDSTVATFSNEENESLEVNVIVQEMESILKRSRLITRLQSLNNFNLDQDANGYLPFICDNFTVGLVSPEVLHVLRQFPGVFTMSADSISFNDHLDSLLSRSGALNSVLMELSIRGFFSNALNGWRNECYEIRNNFTDPTMFRVERAASPLLGVRKYGVQINGYVRHASLGTCLWLQQRSVMKPTWPGMMDNFVGGGVTEGLSVAETAVKEAAEEAGVDADLAAGLVPVGSVSFLHRTERGLHPNTEFVFDLELPQHFVPVNTDGEVGGWTLVPVHRLTDVVCSDKFKITSAPVVIDFMVRWGFIEPDQEMIDLLHYPLDMIYNCSKLV